MSAHQGMHEEHAQDVGAYVLGALPAPEHEAFVAHLASCASCREEVERLQVVADALPLAAPQLRAPAELKDRVMQTLGAEAPAGAARAAAGESRISRARERIRIRWPLVAVPALAAIAVVLAVIALAGGGEGTHSSRVVRAQVLAPGATASLRISDGRGQLEISGMPQAPARHTYEVWVQRSSTPQPTDSLFTVSSSGRASVGVPGSLRGVKAVLVTAEPLGGSRVPTSSPVLVARVS